MARVTTNDIIVLHLSNSQMVVTDVYNHRFHKIFQVDEMLSHIMERDDLFV